MKIYEITPFLLIFTNSFFVVAEKPYVSSVLMLLLAINLIYLFSKYIRENNT